MSEKSTAWVPVVGVGVIPGHPREPVRVKRDGFLRLFPRDLMGEGPVPGSLISDGPRPIFVEGPAQRAKSVLDPRGTSSSSAAEQASSCGSTEESNLPRDAKGTVATSFEDWARHQIRSCFRGVR